MKKYILLLFLFLCMIVPISAKNHKIYWIECDNFPYDFIVETSQPIKIHYLDKRVIGMQNLINTNDINHHIQLKMDDIKQDFALSSFPMYNFDTNKVQQYFYEIIQKIQPSDLFHLSDYMEYECSLQELQQWYQLILDKPKIIYQSYPTLLFQNQRYLLNDQSIPL